MNFWRRWWRGRQGGAQGAADGRWIVVDTETSGLDPGRDRLLAIGGVAVGDAGIRVDDSFEIVLRGEPAGTASNIAVHGIGHDAQRSGVPGSDALASFARWAAGAPRVGFHTDFDRAVLQRAFAEAGLADDSGPWLDLAALAAAVAPEAQRRRCASLDEWLGALGIDCVARHNAAADAFATAELLLCLKSMASAQGVRGFDGLRRVGRHRKWLDARD